MRTVVEDRWLLPCVLGRGRLDEPLERQLNAGGDDERGDAVLGGLEHLGRLVLDDVEALPAWRSSRAGSAASVTKTWERGKLPELREKKCCGLRHGTALARVTFQAQY